MEFPLYIITYEPTPNYLPLCLINKNTLGWNVLPLTPDKYKVWKNKNAPVPEGYIRMGHAPFKHFKELTLPRFIKYKDDFKGFFIAEGDVIIEPHFTPQYFKENYDITKPYWLGYKKRLKDYIVGNFLLYFPSSFLETLKEECDKKKRPIFSDRFFSQLVFKGLIEVIPESVATEIPHISGTTGKFRK
jgi:hypothetical protein